MQENDGAGWPSARLERIRPVPVLYKMPRIYRATSEVPIDRNAVFGVKLLNDVLSKGFEDACFRCKIFCPIGGIKLFYA